MTFLPERLIHGVFVLSFAIFASSLLLIALAVGRRVSREREFRLLDDFRSKIREVFGALRQEMIEYGEALRQLRGALSVRPAPALEQLLLEHLNVAEGAAGAADAAHADLTRRVVEDLGLVEEWQRRLRRRAAGPAPKGTRRNLFVFGFLARARAAENLGRVRHRGSWKLLAEALEDPNGEVQRVALRSLAAIREPESFPVLVEYARQSVAQRHPWLSERELRAVLSRFPLEVSGQLLPLLRERDLRLLAADVLLEMLAARRAAEGGAGPEAVEAGPEIIEAALASLATADSPEMRARIAGVLGYASDERAGRALDRLLNDEVWFVRLRAVSAFGGRQDGSGAAQLLDRLTDPHWRVREAAARLLARSGAGGLDQLLDTFLTIRDAYAREQIAEELEKSGELERILSRCSRPAGGRELRVLSEMVRMGRTRSLETALDRRTLPRQRAAILAGLATSADSHTQEWASQLRIQ